MSGLRRRAALALACLCAASIANAEGAATGPTPGEPLMLVHSNETPTAIIAKTISAEEPAPLTPVTTDTLKTESVSEPKPRSLSTLVDSLRSPQTSSRELECLAGAIYFESKSEPLAGQLAVGQVIANRAKSGRFPSTYCGVIFQRGQFSFVRGRSLPSIPRSSRQWHTAVAVANIVDKAMHVSAVPKALFFHARRVSPAWRLTRLATIGNHVFYR